MIRRPYAPMTQEDVNYVHTAKRRVRALEFIVAMCNRNGGKSTAEIAAEKINQIKAEIYQRYDIHL